MHVGRGSCEPQVVREQLELAEVREQLQDEDFLKLTAPPQGLILKKIDYE